MVHVALRCSGTSAHAAPEGTHCYAAVSLRRAHLRSHVGFVDMPVAGGIMDGHKHAVCIVKSLAKNLGSIRQPGDVTFAKWVPSGDHFVVQTRSRELVPHVDVVDVPLLWERPAFDGLDAVEFSAHAAGTGTGNGTAVVKAAATATNTRIMVNVTTVHFEEVGPGKCGGLPVLRQSVANARACMVACACTKGCGAYAVATCSNGTEAVECHLYAWQDTPMVSNATEPCYVCRRLVPFGLVGGGVCRGPAPLLQRNVSAAALHECSHACETEVECLGYSYSESAESCLLHFEAQPHAPGP